MPTVVSWRNTPAKQSRPITARDRLAAIECNQWLRPSERATIRALLAGDPDDEQINLLHRDLTRRLQERGRA